MSPTLIWVHIILSRLKSSSSHPIPPHSFISSFLISCFSHPIYIISYNPTHRIIIPQSIISHVVFTTSHLHYDIYLLTPSSSHFILHLISSCVILSHLIPPHLIILIRTHNHISSGYILSFHLIFISLNTHHSIVPCSLIFVIPSYHISFNTLRSRQNGRYFADDIFKCILLNENVWIPIKISLKFVPKGPINNNPALVQIMAWCRPGDKPLSEPMVVSLLTQICVTRPQWVNHHHYTPAQRSWRGGILDSPCPSVCPSVRLCVDDMVSGA